MESQLFSLGSRSAGVGELVVFKDNEVVNSIDKESTVSTTVKSNEITGPARYLKDTNNNKGRMNTGAGIKKNVRQEAKKLSQKDSDNLVQAVLQFNKDTIKKGIQKAKKKLSNDVGGVITYLYNGILKTQELHKKKGKKDEEEKRQMKSEIKSINKTISTLHSENRGLKEEIKRLRQEEQQKKAAPITPVAPQIRPAQSLQARKTPEPTRKTLSTASPNPPPRVPVAPSFAQVAAVGTNLQTG